MRAGGQRRGDAAAIVGDRTDDELREQEHLPATTPISKRRKQRAKGPKPSCETCYFGARMLCALDLNGPCSTFRPDSPAGLVPPQQPMLLVEADAAAAA